MSNSHVPVITYSIQRANGGDSCQQAGHGRSELLGTGLMQYQIIPHIIRG